MCKPIYQTTIIINYNFKLKILKVSDTKGMKKRKRFLTGANIIVIAELVKLFWPMIEQAFKFIFGIK